METNKKHQHEKVATSKGGGAGETDAASFPVVAVGASAGGLEALTKLFQAVPAESGMAFVVVQHLSPDHESMMGELLSKHTGMPIRQAGDGETVERDHVYLIPPRKNMTLYHRRLFLVEQTRVHGHVNYPIDVFFESMAQDLGRDAIAVILSGTGSDGTRGLRTIKGAGGLVVVQDPDTAPYDGMPRSAVGTGLVDLVLPAEKIPGALVRYLDYPDRVLEEMETAADQQEVSADGIAKILSRVRKHVGIDFSAYKPTTVTRRIEHRMSIRQIPSIDDYVDRLDDSDEVNALAREMLIGVTRFFRNVEAWKALAEKVIPEIVDSAGVDGRSAVRCWSVGCSTGEEAYTLAMLFHEALTATGAGLEVKVFATDVDTRALRTAARGVYPDSIAADVSPERLQRFFVKDGDQYRVSRELRQSVIFAPHDILKDPPFSRLDLVSCRNLLIYLKPERQKTVLSNFGYALGNGGFLLLGKSENTGGDESSLFAPVDGPCRLFRYTGDRHTGVAISTDPVPAWQRDTAGTKQPQHTPRRKRPLTAMEDLFEEVIRDHMPPAVIFNARNQVLHLFGSAERFLRLPSGKVDMDLLRMVRKDIRVLVGTALFRARETGERVVYAGIPLQGADGADGDRVDLVVDTCTTQEDVEYGVVVFKDRHRADRFEPNTDEEAEAVYDVDADTQERIEDLQRRLRFTEQDLQATVEELETSNEELQATNEELMASNEELQSTNEELQSVNEELVTVNAELQEKIRKLTEVNDDLDNLLENVITNSLFLDHDLRIRRFTPSTADLIHLRSGDEGRPIHHLSHAFGDLDLAAAARAVLESDAPTERDVQAGSGRWYRMRVIPYRTADGRTDGVVLTFQDVTDAKHTEQELQQLRQRHGTTSA